MTEQEANEVMNEIHYLSVVAQNVPTSQAGAVLRHLYDLHKLRDREVYWAIDRTEELWHGYDDCFWDMQTF